RGRCVRDRYEKAGRAYETATKRRGRRARPLYFLEEGKEAVAQGVAALAELALGGGVLRAALGRLDPQRLVAQLRQVVGRGAHVELADLAGQPEGVQRQVA